MLRTLANFSEAKGGGFFFFSPDKRYMIKSLNAEVTPPPLLRRRTRAAAPILPFVLRTVLGGRRGQGLHALDCPG
eukprot:5056342-Prymnesium_polylepis.2